MPAGLGQTLRAHQAHGSDRAAVAERARLVALYTRDGQSLRQIGIRLGIAPRSVGRYRQRLGDPDWTPRRANPRPTPTTHRKGST